MRDGLLDELVGAVDVRQRLEQVDDVDAVTLGEDEALHLRVPATGLVTEVDAALQQLPHRDDGHGRISSCVLGCILTPRRAAPRRGPMGAATADTGGGRGVRSRPGDPGRQQKCTGPRHQQVTALSTTGRPSTAPDHDQRTPARLRHSSPMNRTLLATPLFLLTLAAAGPPPQAPAPPPPEQAARAAPRTGVWPLGPPRPPRPARLAATRHALRPRPRGIDLAAPPAPPSARPPADASPSAAPSAAAAPSPSLCPHPRHHPLRTTYEPVRSLLPEGTAVTTGQVIATTTADPASRCAATCLHWGLRRGDTYLDPLALLPPGLLRRPPSRLLPLAADP